MQVRPLVVEGAYEFTPRIFPDRRGLFTAPFQSEVFTEAVGKPLFPVAQHAHSRSRRDVARGVHYTSTPPGMATYVYCPQGKMADFAVDLRVGSPTFGRHEMTILDPMSFRALYLPVGMGHAFVALEDDTVVSYLLSGGYVPQHEKAVSFFDPKLALALPPETEPILSDRDREAVSLDEALAAETLPNYTDCLAIENAPAP